jgi:hypothetical protein
MTQRVGIEDLHVERIDDGSANIRLGGLAWCWIRGVESEMAGTTHVDTLDLYQCEFRNSYFHHAHGYGNGGQGYGVALWRGATRCLVENNIFRSLRHGMLLFMGAAGNVIGYNYSREPRNAPGDDFVQADVSFHGHYPSHNLIEGNVVQKITVSDWWGPAGPGNTLLRNCVQAKGILVDDASHGQNILGNFLAPGTDIWIDDSVRDTFVHGNVINGVVQWDSDTPDHESPASLYLPFAPDFFEGLEWPAIGPDVNSGCSNPALKRWQDGKPVPEAYNPRAHAVRRVERRVQPLEGARRGEKALKRPPDRER